MTLDHQWGPDATRHCGSGFGDVPNAEFEAGLAAVGVVEATCRRRLRSYGTWPAALHHRRCHHHEQADLRDEEKQEHTNVVGHHRRDHQLLRTSARIYFSQFHVHGQLL
jgi:hypothetical protein